MLKLLNVCLCRKKLHRLQRMHQSRHPQRQQWKKVQRVSRAQRLSLLHQQAQHSLHHNRHLLQHQVILSVALILFNFSVFGKLINTIRRGGGGVNFVFSGTLYYPISAENFIHFLSFITETIFFVVIVRVLARFEFQVVVGCDLWLNSIRSNERRKFSMRRQWAYSYR